MQIVIQSTCKIKMFFFIVEGKFKGSPYGKTQESMALWWNWQTRGTLMN